MVKTGPAVLLVLLLLMGGPLGSLAAQNSGSLEEAPYRLRYSRSLNRELRSEDGWLFIGSSPLDAVISSSDDRLDGLTTPVLLRLPAGPYRMTLSLEDYGGIDIRVEVRPGELSAIDVPMSPEYTILSSQSGDVRWSGTNADGAVVVPYGTIRVTSQGDSIGVLEPVYPAEDRARIAAALVPVLAAGTIGLAILEALVPIDTPTKVPLFAAGGSIVTAGAIAVHVPIQLRRQRYIDEFTPPVPTYFAADALARMDDARAAAEAGDTVAAVAAYGEVIDRYGNVPVVSDALVARARLLFAEGAYDAALDDLERAVYEFPSPDTIDQAGLLMADILYLTGAESEIAILYEVLPMLEGSGTAAEFDSFELP